MQDEDGRWWIYLQASVTLAQGNAVEPASYAAINADVDAAAAVDTIRVTGTGDFTAATLVDMTPTLKNGHIYTLWIDAGAAQGQGGPIIRRVDNNNVDVYFINSNDGKIATALTTTSDFIVYTLTRIKKATTVHATLVLGYVQRQGGITDEYWFWALAKGEGLGLIDTSGTAIVGGTPVTTGPDDGTLEGVDTSAAAEAFFRSGYGILDQDADGLIPIVADCPIIARPRVPTDTGKAYPRP